MPTWPTGLPKPRLGGFTRRHGEGFVGFRADKTGAEKRRRVTTSAPSEQGHPMRLTAAEWETLCLFYDDDCSGGASRFTFTDDLSGGTIEAAFVEGSPPEAAGNTAVPRFDVMVRLRIWPVYSA